MNFDEMPASMEVRLKRELEDVKIEFRQGYNTILLLVARFVVIRRGEKEFEVTIGPQEVEKMVEAGGAIAKKCAYCYQALGHDGLTPLQC